ncbi:Ent-kaurene oxidase [Sphaerulina musiva]
MAAIHTTSISITNVLLDLCTLPDASSVVEAIGELHRVDSTIKESMRLRSFGLIGTNRVVTYENGIRFGDGTPIPAGVRIATPIDAIYRDSQFY